MKKLFAITFAILLFLSPKAQVQTMTAASYTIGTLGTSTLTSGAIKGVTGKVVSIQVVATSNITPLSGTCTLYGSVDGTNFVALSAVISGISTFTLNPVSTYTVSGLGYSSFIWEIPRNYYEYYRIVTVNTATISASGTMSGYIIGRPQ